MKKSRFTDEQIAFALKQAETGTMKGVKLPPKYRNPLDPNQTWTGRGVDPSWVAKLREAGLLKFASIQST